MFNYPLDSDYMTFREYLARLRKDLNDPDFAVFDDRAAESEEEYQVKLDLFKKVLKKDRD